MGTLWLSFQYSLITPKMKTSSIEELKKKKQFRFSDLQTWPVFLLKCYHYSNLTFRNAAGAIHVSVSVYSNFSIKDVLDATVLHPLARLVTHPSGFALA